MFSPLLYAMCTCFFFFLSLSVCTQTIDNPSAAASQTQKTTAIYDALQPDTNINATTTTIKQSIWYGFLFSVFHYLSRVESSLWHSSYLVVFESNKQISYIRYIYIYEVHRSQIVLQFFFRHDNKDKNSNSLLRTPGQGQP